MNGFNLVMGLFQVSLSVDREGCRDKTKCLEDVSLHNLCNVILLGRDKCLCYWRPFIVFCFENGLAFLVYLHRTVFWHLSKKVMEHKDGISL